MKPSSSLASTTGEPITMMIKFTQHNYQVVLLNNNYVSQTQPLLCFIYFVQLLGFVLESPEIQNVQLGFSYEIWEVPLGLILSQI